MTHPDGDSIMKHSHIGLVALAAMAIAGCGGGSDNGSGSGGSVTDTETLLGGLAFTLPSGTTIRNGQSRTIAQRTIKCDGPKDCALTVTGSAAEGYELTSTGGMITVTLASPPRQENQQNNQLQQDNNRLTQENNQLQQDKNRLQKDLNIERQQGNLRVRVPKLLGRVDTTDEFDADNSLVGVTVTHTRADRAQKIAFPAIGTYDNPTSLTDISSWPGVRYARDLSGFNEALRLYTNIGNPNTRKFWKVHADASTNRLGIQVTVNSSSLQGVASGTRAVAQNEDDDDAGTFENVTTGIYDRVTVSGNLGGASGTFTCTSGCSGGIADTPIDTTGYISNGKPSFDSDEVWDFTPASRRADYNRPQDETYLYFGLWAQHPESENGDYRANAFRWIAGGGELSSLPSTLKGTARFEGDAVGQYAIGEVGDRKAKEGIFTATATLNADFGDGTTAGGNISGRITGFQENGSPLTAWETLHLGGTALATDPASQVAFTEAALGTGATAGKIEGSTLAGTWGATLYGVNNPGAVGVGEADRPSGYRCQDTGCDAELAGVAGWFNASGRIAAGATNVDTAIVGAFGAAHKP